MSRTHKLTSLEIAARKGSSKIVAVTCYDFTFARILDPLVDVLLVGDSLGMVMQGANNTLSVTMDQAVYHSRCVAKGAAQAHVVADMPFMSYQASEEDALRNGGRLLAEGLAQSVKLEGGVRMAGAVEKMVNSGIPVMGHIGLTPQSVNALGGYKIQGKTTAGRDSLMMDAIALAEAGAYAIVLEGVPAELAAAITERIQIPTIGIGAGPSCDGQVLVLQDLLGLNPEFNPKFLKKYASLAGNVAEAITQYGQEVREGTFPARENSFYVDP